MQLAEIVPWGRSFAEYRLMFNLTDADLEKKILGCGDGPASFNAELTQGGGQVVSVDPLYRFDRQQIEQRIDETAELVLAQVKENMADFIWQQIASVARLEEIRRSAMTQFLSDFLAGKASGRYLDGQLPQLPGADKCFELALCSHLLFLYSEQFSFDMHLQSVRELCRVANEVRIFPLVDLTGRQSPHLLPILRDLEDRGGVARLQSVDYEFQRGGNQMLVVTCLN